MSGKGAPIHLGYEVGTGEPVAIPRHHLVVTGLTQVAGKTTTIEALIQRARVPALAFVTKRGEIGLDGVWKVPYFAERSDWQYVASLLETTVREKLKIQRPFIMKATRGTRTLADVHANVKAALAKAKGFAESIYTELDHYLEIVVPQLRERTFSDRIEFSPGVNLMDLAADSLELQGLVIRSAMEWVREKEKGVITVVPEAWKFVPQDRGSPVKLAAEQLIREGAVLGNYVWLDSQDLAGIDATIRKSLGVWILGRQPEANEARRTLEHLPVAKSIKPKVEEVQRLGIGQFYVVADDRVRKVYVQPAWMEAKTAQGLAAGGHTVNRGVAEHFGKPTPSNRIELVSSWPEDLARGRDVAKLVSVSLDNVHDKEDSTMCQEHRRLATEVDKLRATERALLNDLSNTRGLVADTQRRFEDAQKLYDESRAGQQAALKLREALQELGIVAAAGTHLWEHGVELTALPVDTEAIVAEVLRRMPAGGASAPVLAPEALKREFQQAEAARLVEAAQALTPTTKKILKLLVALDRRMTLKVIAERIGRGMGGSMKDAITPLRDLEWVDADSNGYKATLREKIVADLGTYGATDAEIEAVYQQVVYQLAAEA